MAPSIAPITPPGETAPAPTYLDNVNSRSLPSPPYDDSGTASLVAQITNLNLNDLDNQDDFPTVDQAIAHLELLNAFFTLKEDIKTRDGLFNLYDADTGAKCSLEEMQEKRWVVYVTQAVERYRSWWEAISRIPNGPALQVRHMTISSASPTYSEAFREASYVSSTMTRDVLPPLDVLLVWHSHKLNPRCYYEDCIRAGNIGVFHTPFPWSAVHASIDANTGLYKPGPAAERDFAARTHLAWSKITPVHYLKCPVDHSRRAVVDVPVTSYDPSANNPTHFEVPWTTCGTELRSTGGSVSYGASGLSPGKGYADVGFEAFCPTCQLKVDHEQLRAAKFMREAGLVNGLAQMYPNSPNQTPLGGTILSSEGVWTGNGDVQATGSFARAVVAAMLQSKPAGQWYTSLKEVRDGIETIMRDSKLMKGLNQGITGVKSRFVPPTSRAEIRRMMARYWDNSSPFSLDLIGAVIRQGVFIIKMHDLDWLNSPAVSATTARLVAKYERFMELMSIHSYTLLVPTLDVDLAWHTHQLSSHKYYDYTVQSTSRFTDHDDKIAESALSDAFATTSKLYQERYNEPYSECLCWYCESIRAAHAPTKGHLFAKKLVTTDAEKQLYAHAKEITDNPMKGAHISAHNAIVFTDQSKRSAYLTAKARAKLDKDYEKACKRAIKDGRKPPKREQARGSDPYGYAYGYYYPFPMPMYYGAGYPMYVGNPGCGSGAPGAAGNCAAGTCGGGVAMGSCSAGTGGLGGMCTAGGATGGCGGMGSGGGTCGGGGSGGGCGGGGGGCGGGGGG